MKGREWQDYVEKLLNIKYSDEYYQVPDKTNGDHGIEGFTKNGKTFQFYASEASDDSGGKLYESQRDKISADIKKFIDNAVELEKLFDQIKINEWVFVVPYFDNKALLKHASTKAGEVRSKNLNYVTPDFRISIVTESNYWTERQRLIGETSIISLPKNPWSKLLFQHQFYSNISDKQREELAYFAETSWKEIASNLSEDYESMPWFRMDMPRKFANNISLLLNKDNLNEIELCLIFIISILREVVIDNLISESEKEQIDFFNFQEQENPSNLRVSFEQNSIRFPRFKRKIQSLINSEKVTEAKVIVYWLLKKSIINNPKSWRSQNQNGFFNSAILDRNIFDEGGDVKLILQNLDILNLLSYLFKEAYYFDASENKVLNEKISLRLANGKNEEIRQLLLVVSLSMTERMSFDIANLNDVIIDYFGMPDELSVEDLIKTLEEINWVEDANLLQVNIKTQHPAIDFAIRFQIEHLNYHATLLSLIIGKSHTQIPNQLKIPRFSGERIEIEQDTHGESLFKVPHLSFKLSETEVKELIIGGALYGDKGVAVRELYQNALDACRFKRARLQYLSRKSEGNPTFETSEFWKGKISFRKGIHEGRPYIECFDNGVGMGLKEIREVFANAGRRYADQKEFQEERYLWSQVNPAIELFPNSQFGIGVFSYFLLSDEIEVRTRKFNENGRLGDCIEVKIYGSGNLCKVKVIDPIPELDKSGTIIRLFLHLNNVDFSPLQLLNSWLVVPEFEVSILENTSSQNLEASKLNPNSHYINQKIVIPTEDKNIFLAVPDDNTDIYSFRNQGLILQDGIRVTQSHNPFIINLLEKEKVKLTVDRTNLLNRNSDYLRIKTENIISNVTFEYLINNIRSFSLSQLSFLTEEFPEIIDKLFSELRKKETEINLTISHRLSHINYDILRYGIQPYDYHIISYLLHSQQESDKLRIKEQLLNRYHNSIVSERISFLEGIIETSTVDPESPFSKYLFQPADYYFLNKVFSFSSSNDFNQIGFSIIAIYKHAEELGITPKELYERLTKFKVFGLPTVEYDFSLALPILTEDEEQILKTKFMTMGGWLGGEITPYILFHKSFELNKTIGEVLTLLSQFTKFNIVLPEIKAKYLNHVVTEEDLYVLGFYPEKFYYQKPESKIEFLRVYSLVRALNKQPKEIINLFKNFEDQFGFEIQEEELISLLNFDFETYRVDLNSIKGIGEETGWKIVDLLKRNNFVNY